MTQPKLFDDSDVPTSGGAPKQQSPKQRSDAQDSLEEAHDSSAPLLRRSSRVHVPTSRADPSNAPLSRVQKAVQDSIAANKRVQVARVERCCGTTVIDCQEPEIADQDTETRGMDHIMDLANVASIEDLDYLLTAADTYGNNPLGILPNDEPRTWSEAKVSGDASKWEAAYQEELTSLKEMGVYKLVPRSDIPAGHKIRTGRPVFKIKCDEHGTAV